MTLAIEGLVIMFQITTASDLLAMTFVNDVMRCKYAIKKKKMQSNVNTGI